MPSRESFYLACGACVICKLIGGGAAFLSARMLFRLIIVSKLLFYRGCSQGRLVSQIRL